MRGTLGNPTGCEAFAGHRASGVSMDYVGLLCPGLGHLVGQSLERHRPCSTVEGQVKRRLV